MQAQVSAFSRLSATTDVRGRSAVCKPARSLYLRAHAEVAELADAPDSKSGARQGVWVRFPPSALPLQQADAGRGRYAACSRSRCENSSAPAIGIGGLLAQRPVLELVGELLRTGMKRTFAQPVRMKADRNARRPRSSSARSTMLCARRSSDGSRTLVRASQAHSPRWPETSGRSDISLTRADGTPVHRCFRATSDHACRSPSPCLPSPLARRGRLGPARGCCSRAKHGPRPRAHARARVMEKALMPPTPPPRTRRSGRGPLPGGVWSRLGFHVGRGAENRTRAL